MSVGEEEPKYISTIEKIQHEWKKHQAKYSGSERPKEIKELAQTSKSDPLEEIRQSLRFMMDKFESLNMVIRQSSRYGKPKGETVDGEFTKEQKEKIIKEFLVDMKQGKYSKEEMLMLTNEK